MRRYVILAAIAIAGLALASCTQSAAPTASAVWTDTLASKAYQKWQPAPGFETTQAATGPHGKSVQVFIDPTVATAMSGTTATEWPVGSMIVKDAYDAAGAMQAIEYMQKTDSGWYFASFGLDGTVSTEGVKVEPCEACHLKGSDSVRSFKLP